jgi:hypothetical protein
VAGAEKWLQVLGWWGRCRPRRPWICPKPAEFVASRSAKRDTEGHPDSVNLTVPAERLLRSLGLADSPD